MFKYTCLNPIADVGLNNLTDEYTKTDDFAEADAVLVRSAAMHDMELSDNLCAVARAGAGVNNIPLDKWRLPHRCRKRPGRRALGPEHPHHPFGQL